LSGLDRVADVLDDAAQPVLDHGARAVAALQLVLEAELDAFLALVLDVGEAHHVRRGFALGVRRRYSRCAHALDAQRLDLLPELFVDLAAQPGEVAASVQPRGRPVRPAQASSLPSALRCAASACSPWGWPRSMAPARWWPAAGRCGRGCGRGWPAPRLHEALLALLLVEVGADDLHLYTARPMSSRKASATSTTTKRERHGGVFEASSGLVA
jgi:hypothetical protein